MKMANNPSLGRRWEDYRPSKGIWFWSCLACIVATVVIGFGWGGWVTGGTARKMAADAAAGANAQLAAADCVSRFENGPDATAQLAALKKAEQLRTGRSDQKGWLGYDAREQRSRGRRCGYLRSAARGSEPAGGQRLK